MKRKLFLCVSLALLCLVLVASTVLGYQYSNKRWDNYDTHYYAYYDTSALSSAWEDCVIDAAVTWNQAGADFRFSWTSSSPNDFTTGDLEGAPGPLAETTVSSTWYYPNDYYTITECDTIFNSEDYTFHTDGSDYNLQHVATHELGHWLCLYHSSDPDAIMYPYYQNKCNLDSDDITGIKAIYGEE